MNQAKTDTPPTSPLYDFNGKLEFSKVAPLGLQHVVAAVVGIVTPALIVGSAAGLASYEITLLIQASLVFTAIATLLQLFPIGPIGARLPIIMGTSFAYIPTMLAIVGEFGIAALFGAQIIGGLVAIVFGIFLKQLRKLFPPVVTGTVIFTIGLSLYNTGVNNMAGGATARAAGTIGEWNHWLVAVVTLLVVIICGNFTKGITKLASILMGLIAGYVLSLFLGMVNFAPVAEAAWFTPPAPLQFGIEFVPAAIISMAVMFTINSVQTVGDLSACTMGGFDREAETRELAGGIVAQGITAIVGAFFGGLPKASYSQNVGIVTVNKVVNRMVFVFAAGVLLLAGIVPRFASVLTTIPNAVVGGATVSVFAIIAMTGIRMFIADGFSMRKVTIVGLSVALGMGITGVGDSLAGLPTWVGSVFGASPVVIAASCAIILNTVLPKEAPPAPK